MSINSSTEKFLAGLKSTELLLKLTWDEWLAIQAPYTDGKLTTVDAWARYHRNGYDWDMHGTLYTPEKETDPRRAFVFFHGGAGSERIMDLTPDGRPGLARTNSRSRVACAFRSRKLNVPRFRTGWPSCSPSWRAETFIRQEESPSSRISASLFDRLASAW